MCAVKSKVKYTSRFINSRKYYTYVTNCSKHTHASTASVMLCYATVAVCSGCTCYINIGRLASVPVIPFAIMFVVTSSPYAFRCRSNLEISKHVPCFTLTTMIKFDKSSYSIVVFFFVISMPI